MPTQRFIDNATITDTQENDVMVLVDVSDVTNSSDGTDKSIRISDLFNNAIVTHATNATIKRKLGEWVGEFKDAITGLVDRTGNATTTKVGVSKRATTQQAQAQTSQDTTLSPHNLAGLTATANMQGLAKQGTVNEVKEGRVSDKMISPETAFLSLLGTAALGATAQTFTLPLRNLQGDIYMELKAMIFEVEVDTVRTSANPTNNYNHIHPYFDIPVNYPQPLDNTVLMITPMSLDVEGDGTSTGSDFWVRQHTHDLAKATLRCTRINGTGPIDPLEKIRVRVMVVGY